MQFITEKNTFDIFCYHKYIYMYNQFSMVIVEVDKCEKGEIFNSNHFCELISASYSKSICRRTTIIDKDSGGRMRTGRATLHSLRICQILDGPMSCWQLKS